MSQYDAQKVTYQEVTIFDRPALFTECRIDRTTVPEGVYRYELRHGDEDWGEPRELARGLMVNFYGTVLTREPFQLPIDGWIPLESGSLSFQDGGCRTLAEFQEKYPASEKDVIDFYSVNEPALHALYFSRSEEQDKSAGCVGHLRGDFGSGKQFYTTWWPHQQDALNTPEFKADIDRTVNWLREQPDSPLRDFDSMNRYCNRYEQICAIKGALLPSCGFMVKTKRYHGYKIGRVFDVTQTHGKAGVPALSLKDNTPEMDAALRRLLDSSPVSVVTSSTMYQDAVYDPKTQSITVSSRLIDSKIFAALSREIVHAGIHDHGRYPYYTREDCAMDAESVSYMLCRNFGVETPQPDVSRVGQVFDGMEVQDRRGVVDSLQKYFRKLQNDIQREISPQERKQPEQNRPVR